nr:RagB/SusD family nutrient uptake outer membrane protein [Sphingobacterium hungaricum]
MKKITINTFLGLLVLLMLSRCNNDFMERYPLDKITDINYWQTENDLTLYVNNFYPIYVVGFGFQWQDQTIQPRGVNVGMTVYGDMLSDNAAPLSQNLYSSNLYTSYLTSDSKAIGYSYENIRSLNIFLENYNRVQIDQTIKNRYKGEVLFFKVYDYFDKLKNWGEVSWLSNSLQTNSEELYLPKTSREELLDSMITNLDLAIEYLPEGGSESNNRINKQMALFLKARIGLYEGTFRKYHNVANDANKFLEYCVDASEEIMSGGKYNLIQGDKNAVYYNLFATNTYVGNTEVILAREYSTALSYGSAFSRYFTQNLRHQFGATRSLVDDYLCEDGLSISSSPLFLGKESITLELQKRDPRLTQTIANYGTYNLAVGVSQGADNAPYPNLQGMSGNKCPTGYRLAKWWYNNPTDWNATTNGQQAGLMWRYAEVLLNYAEAKFELGEISQTVIDNTINKLRDRVKMPHLIIGNEPSDTRLDNIYTTYLGGTINATLREIRRERRVELAFENTRWDDLVRWKAGKLL